MQERQETTGKALLTAKQVQDLLHVDRSTVYRMADDGRLPAVKIGRQWRFPAAAIDTLLGGLDAAGGIEPSTGRGEPVLRSTLSGPALPSALNGQRAVPVIELAADLLGVMMVVTDMDGCPLTPVVNPCRWFAARQGDPFLVEACAVEWRQFADEVDLGPRFRTGRLGFDCARSFVRVGTSLVAMVLAGGIAPLGEPADPDLYHLDDAQRQRVLGALPRVAAALSSAPARTERPLDGRNAS